MKLPWHSNSGELRIDSLRRRKAGRRGANVSANVGGLRIWFESGDEELTAAPEAFGSAMLIPALHAQRPLVIVPEVCAVWAQNICGWGVVTCGQTIAADVPRLVIPAKTVLFGRDRH